MNKTTKIILGVVILAVIVLIVVFYKPAPKGTIKIGVIAPLTGSNASYGQRLRKGIDLAIEDVNQKLDKVKIEAVYEDTQGDPTQSVTAIRKLIDVDGIKGVLTILSGVSGAVAPIAQEQKIPMFTFSLSSNITDVGDFIFQPHPRATDEGIADAGFLMDKDATSVAILYTSAESGVGMNKGFLETFKGKIVFDEMYTKGSQDFRTQLLKIKKFNPSWLYLPGYDTEVGYIIKQAKELGINANFLSVEGVNSQTLLNITGDLANGLIYSTAILDPDKSDATIQDIFARYQKKYGEEVNFYAGEAYDAIVLFAGVVKDGAKDTQVIRDRMAAVKNFKGISGVITFDEQRHTVKKFGYFIIKNGQFVPYEE